jgi:hypothetical protein
MPPGIRGRRAPTVASSLGGVGGRTVAAGCTPSVVLAHVRPGRAADGTLSQQARTRPRRQRSAQPFPGREACPHRAQLGLEVVGACLLERVLARARACSSACSRPQANPLAPSVSASARSRRRTLRSSMQTLVVAHQGLQVLGGAGKPLGGPAEGGRDGLCRVEGTFGGPLRVFVQELVASRTGATPSARPGKYAPGGLTRGALARPRPPRPMPAADPVSGRHGEPVSPIDAGRQSTDRASDWSQLRLSARVHVSHRH